MASRNITIDLEAYKRLKEAKLGKESFSSVIKRLFPKPVDIDAIIQKIERDPIGEDVLSVVEEQIKNRRRRKPRSRDV